MAVDLAKFNVQIAAEQREIEKDYRIIGEWYTATLEGEAPEAIADMVAAITAAKEKIAQLEEEREQRRNAGNEILHSEGSVVEETEEAVEEPSQRVCPVCGCVSDGRFCPDCGSPMGK